MISRTLRAYSPTEVIGSSSPSQCAASQCPQLNWMTAGLDANLRHQPRLMRTFCEFAQLPSGHFTSALPDNALATSLQ